MDDTHHLKRGNTAPSLLWQIYPADIDLTGATVTFAMRFAESKAVKVARTPAVIVQATAPPIVRYDWKPGDVDEIGHFDADFRATYVGGANEDLPNLGFISVVIGENIP